MMSEKLTITKLFRIYPVTCAVRTVNNIPFNVTGLPNKAIDKAEGEMMTTQTDRELLDLAAKAVHLVLWPIQDDGPYLLAHGGDNPIKWDPLTDDGDALRLAVNLDMSMLFSWSELHGTRQRKVWSPVHGGDATEVYKDDHYEATRRAIVRAAAAIGAAS